MTSEARCIHIGVLALQGAFSEHIDLLRQAFLALKQRDVNNTVLWSCEEIRTPEALARCDALVVPGGESTTMVLVAERSGLLEPLRDFVKVQRKPTWGTCAGLILLAEVADRTKKGGQDLIGGLDVRVRRNHFGRQVESFETQLSLPFLEGINPSVHLDGSAPFKGVFIRAPIVEKILGPKVGAQAEEEVQPETVVAPSRVAVDPTFAHFADQAQVEIMATLPGRQSVPSKDGSPPSTKDKSIIAVRQSNCFGLSFHPELTGDIRIHVWWLQQVETALMAG